MQFLETALYCLKYDSSINALCLFFKLFLIAEPFSLTLRWTTGWYFYTLKKLFSTVVLGRIVINSENSW